MKILILTTAINRPKLHNLAFEQYKKMITPDMDVTWVINIDYIEKLKATVDETKENLQGIFRDYENVNLLFVGDGGSWLNRAVRRVAKEAKKYVDDVDVVLYLEDDWAFRGKVPNLEAQLIEDVGENWREKEFLVCLSERIFLTDKWINLQPQLWSPDLFKVFIEVLDTIVDENRSAELILERNFYKFYNSPNIVKTRHKMFRDVGRRWMHGRGLQKRNKNSKNYSGKDSTYEEYTGYKSYRDYVYKSRVKDTGWDVTRFDMDINGERVGIDLPYNYNDLVKNIKSFFDKQLEEGGGSYALKGILTQFHDPLKCPEILELGEHFARELRDKFYGGECFVTYVHPYKNNKSNAPEAASWKWHYDDVAHGLVKIMVYLNDTDRNNGAFLVLRREKPDGGAKYVIKEPSLVAPGRGKNTPFSETRFTEKDLKGLKDKGFKDYHIEGPAGTFILFNNNIIHKATIAKEEPGRMCVIYHFRPYHEKLDRHIDPKITGDWKGGSNVKSKSYAYAGF